MWSYRLVLASALVFTGCNGSVSPAPGTPVLNDAGLAVSTRPLTGPTTPLGSSVNPTKTASVPVPSSAAPSEDSGVAPSPTQDGGATAPIPSGDAGTGMPGDCLPVRSHKHQPLRAVVSDQTQRAPKQILLTADLFGKFYAECGACHVDQAQGKWQVSKDNFGVKFDAAALARITTDDLKLVMPPFQRKYSEQPAGAPLRDLVAKTQAWLELGSPTDFAIIETPPPSEADLNSPYLLPADVAAQTTDLGTCLPDPKSVGTETARMAELDTLFAGLTRFEDLPKTLSATDLFTLESAALAQHGVISYAPTYTLFSDDAVKMRYLRVPLTKSVEFDPARQEFDVPDNTRIYKTFLKEVTDVTGQPAYRKLETRLIVVRQDLDLGDGKFAPQALFATYAWNEAETEAYLVTDPKRDSKPFADRMVSYFQDDPGTAAFFNDPELYESPTALLTLQNRKLLRHWGIPSSDRCVDCHMGSPSHSFLLGFSPVQLSRVPRGESGEFDTPEGEEVEADELSQLSRLIEYGIVTGITNEAEVARLEDTQIAPPRNDSELKAQAYMVGNCAFCHNPHGLPSVQNPELTDLLNFWPNTYLWPERDSQRDEDGRLIKTVGIFQFPLDRFSPRIRRGPNQDIDIPYITPSVRDYPILNSELQPDNPAIEPAAAMGEVYRASYPKFGSYPRFPPVVTLPADVDVPLPAPWRSLIYRNVETPFTYGDHFAIYPHMPMDVGGYDCRVQGIMAEWMISIPAERREPALDEDIVYCRYGEDEEGGECQKSADFSAQPYVEVSPDGAGYTTAVRAAEQRLEEYYWGPRGPHYCRDTTDLLDPAVLDLDGSYAANAQRKLETPPPGVEFGTLEVNGMSVDFDVLTGAPLRAHWFNTDLTEPAGLEWQPKNLSWRTIFGDPATIEDAGLRSTVTALNAAHLTQPLRELALSERPLGFWQEKPECEAQLGAQLTANQLVTQGIPLPAWLEAASAADRDRPLYMQAPGETLFRVICANCHGPDADSKGRQATLVATLTGGNTRVADFKNGFFGPVTAPGANLAATFDDFGAPGDTVDDVAARYMAFMALGGTQRTIPRAVLSIVRNTSVVGTFREDSPAVASANMLETAVGLCMAVLGHNGSSSGDRAEFDTTYGKVQGKGLIRSNGDAEMWEALCTLNNPLPLRVIDEIKEKDVVVSLYSFKNSDGTPVYPADAPVRNHRAETVVGLDESNLAPWCGNPPSLPGQLPTTEPACPTELVFAGSPYKWDEAQIRAWATRGAINAGFAVYTYLDAFFAKGYQRKPAFNQCEELPAP